MAAAFDTILDAEMLAAPLPGVAIFSRLCGSRGANLHGPGSDWDLGGVYAARTEDILGLAPARDSAVRTGRPGRPDIHFHELGRFCRLLADGVPMALEHLWAERHARLTAVEPLAAAWAELRGRRRDFLTAQAVRKYLGHALGLMREIQETKPASGGGQAVGKRCCHMVRLLQDARFLVEGGEPMPWREGPNWRELPLSFRDGGRPVSEALALAGELTAAIDARKPWPLPEEASTAWLDGWLVGTRLVMLSLSGRVTGVRP